MNWDKAKEILKEKLALDWQIRSLPKISSNLYVLSHPQIIGVLVFDFVGELVMVFDQVPNTAELIKARRFQATYRKPGENIVERLLQAECNVISNRKGGFGHFFTNPFGVFPLLDQAIAVVEAYSEVQNSWVVFTNKDEWEAYLKAYALFCDSSKEGDEITKQKAVNQLYFLTGQPFGERHVVYRTDCEKSGWQLATLENFVEADDDVADALVTCSRCRFTATPRYWKNERQHFLNAMYSEWLNHRKTHCDGVLHQ